MRIHSKATAIKAEQEEPCRRREQLRASLTLFYLPSFFTRARYSMATRPPLTTPARTWRASPKSTAITVGLAARARQDVDPGMLVYLLEQRKSRTVQSLGRARVSTLAQKSGSAVVKVESSREKGRRMNCHMTSRSRFRDYEHGTLSTYAKEYS